MENAVAQHSHFSFEISPTLENNASVRPFCEQRKSIPDSQVYMSTQRDQEASPIAGLSSEKVRDSTVVAKEMMIEDSPAKELDPVAKNNPFVPQDPKKIGPS